MKLSKFAWLNLKFKLFKLNIVKFFYDISLGNLLEYLKEYLNILKDGEDGRRLVST